MIEHISCKPNHPYPNNELLQLCLLREVFPGDGEQLAIRFEQTFAANQWPPAWRNGLYDFHHFHSTAHEALGIYSGWVKACFGGPGGVNFTARVGDVLIIPAGVSHQNLDQSPDFRVVGAYPTGQQFDMRYGEPAEYEEVVKIVPLVPLPPADPIFGADGPLMELWKMNPKAQEARERQ